MPGRGVLRPAKISNRLVTEADEMRDGQFNAMFIIIDHGSNRMRIYGSVNQHQRHVVFGNSADDSVQSMCCGEYQAVHVAGHERLHNCRFIFLVVIRIGKYGDISPIGQRFLDLPNDWGEKRVGQIRYDNANRMCASGAESVRE